MPLLFALLAVAILIAGAYRLAITDLKMYSFLADSMLGHSLNGLKMTLKSPFKLFSAVASLILTNGTSIAFLGLNRLGLILCLVFSVCIVFFFGLIVDMGTECWGPCPD